NLRSANRPERKQAGTKEFVLTLSVPDGEVVKLETLEKSGQRRVISDEEFTAFADEDGGYEHRAEDADVGEDDDESEEEKEIARYILSEIADSRFLRRGIRRLFLRDLVRGEFIRKRVRRGGKPVPHAAAHKATQKNGQEGGREGEG